MSDLRAPIRTYIGLGANIDEPLERIDTAFRCLDEADGIQLRARSRIYRNPPMVGGPPNQPEYFNAVAALDTVLDAQTLLTVLQCIEDGEGRRRIPGVRWGPRSLDLDLLLYGDATIVSDRLTVPYPGILDRAFVVYPLLEIYPEVRIPGLGLVRAFTPLPGREMLVAVESTSPNDP